MFDLIKKWFMTDAKWYEFWMPQSGFVGGLIMGAVVGISILIYLCW